MNNVIHKLTAVLPTRLAFVGTLLGVLALMAALIAAGASSAVPAPPESISVLKRAKTDADALPAGYATEIAQTNAQRTKDRALDGVSSAELPVQLNEVRRVPVALSGGAVWLAPETDGSVCMITASRGELGSGSCFGAAEAAVGPAPHLTIFAPNDIEVSGIAPDGVASVDLALADGTTQTLKVVNNVYTAAVVSATRSVSFEGPNGRRTVEAVSPAT